MHEYIQGKEEGEWYTRYEKVNFEFLSYKKVIPLVSGAHPNVVVVALDKTVCYFNLFAVIFLTY
jgi:hypothetical protein